MRLWPVLLVAALGCGHAPPAQSPATSPPTAAGPRRWVYQLTIPDEMDESKPRAQHELVLTEAARRQVGGHPVIELAVSLDGQPLTPDSLGELLAPAPFDVFGTRLVLLRSGPGIWLLFASDEGASGEDVAAALAETPTWPLAGAPPGNASPEDHEDEPVIYRKQTGRWESVCNGLMHPSPDSGDFFSWERCFSPAIGITRLVFTSVWGSYELQLVTPPADFELP
jgi:hypothetical protein